MQRRAAEQDVLGLEVTVVDLAAVAVGRGREQLAEERARRQLAQRAVAGLSWGMGACHYGPIQTLGTPNLLGTWDIY
jgi:hypothetical protein